MSDQATAPAAAPATSAHAPIDLTTLKDDLGIAAGDTSNDAWLQRRIDGVWARMESYCQRRLCAPPVTFTDNWGQVVVNGVHWHAPPPLAYWPQGSVFLREYPVQSITAVKLSGITIALTYVAWEVASGKLLSLDQSVIVQAPYNFEGLGRQLLSTQ